MKFSETWLREWVDPPLDSAELAEQLTMLGLEVESVTALAGLPEIVVGEVLEIGGHPDADRLRICTVGAGESGAVRVVCGAPNVRVGGRYPLALIGARLPGGLSIKPTKVRGVESSGMLCSAAELGLGDEAEGLLELGPEAVPGESLAQCLQLPDVLFDINLTPNRADCFCIAGVAREVAARNRLPAPDLHVSAVAPASNTRFTVEVEAGEDCPRFAARVIRGLRPGAETPLWMRERLRRAGMRSIHPVVDVTNYVMLELGQPLHAYDLQRIGKRIGARRGRPGERLTLLGGEEVTVDQDVLVIADERGPLGLAGIMGGEASGVDESTTAILLESAFFAPAAIMGRARRYGLHTDASLRFERGVDPEGQIRAIERATGLLMEIAGGEPEVVSVAENSAALPRRLPVPLRRERLAGVLGAEVPDSEVSDILERLGMQSQCVADGWRVVPPAARFDIEIEVDLIEEVARLHGYDRIPEVAGHQETVLGFATETRVPLERVRQVLAARGYQEAMTYSFVAEELDAALGSGASALKLANPLSGELAVMRESLWPGLLGALAHNLARQQESVRLFEAGVVFRAHGAELGERLVVAGVATGTRWPEQWGLARQALDLFDIKGDVQALLGLTGQPHGFRFEPAEHPALHPRQAARVFRSGEPVGWLGALHPGLAERLDIAQAPVLFELDAVAAFAAQARRASTLSKFPSVRRDLAVVVDEEVAVASLIEAAKEAGGGLVQAVIVFDVYAGEPIEPGQKSVALGLILQETSRNLTGKEVDQAMGAVTARLSREFKARIRE